jgi:hypothetical protein
VTVLARLVRAAVAAGAARVRAAAGGSSVRGRAVELEALALVAGAAGAAVGARRAVRAGLAVAGRADHVLEHDLGAVDRAQAVGRAARALRAAAQRQQLQHDVGGAVRERALRRAGDRRDLALVAAPGDDLVRAVEPDAGRERDRAGIGAAGEVDVLALRLRGGDRRGQRALGPRERARVGVTAAGRDEDRARAVAVDAVAVGVLEGEVGPVHRAGMHGRVQRRAVLGVRRAVAVVVPGRGERGGSAREGEPHERQQG